MSIEDLRARYGNFILGGGFGIVRGEVQVAVLWDDRAKQVTIPYENALLHVKRFDSMLGLLFAGQDFTPSRSVVIDSTGSIVYDITHEGGAAGLSFGPTGYFDLTIDFFFGTTGIGYHSKDNTQGVRVIDLPEKNLIRNRTTTYQLGDKLLFSVPGSDFGNDFYVADGATGELSALKDIFPGGGFGIHSTPRLVNGLLYFAGTTDGRNVGLWRTDGTAEGTYQISEVDPSPGFGSNYNYTQTDTALYFAGISAEHGHELFSLALDGGEEVRLYADINPGPESSFVYHIVENDGGIYAVAYPGPLDAAQLFFMGKDLSTSTSEPVVVPEISVYPNPTTDAITVQAGDAETLARATLFDATGRQVMERTLTGQNDRLNVQSLAPGTYLLLVRYTSGGRAFARVSVAR